MIKVNKKVYTWISIYFNFFVTVGILILKGLIKIYYNDHTVKNS